MERDLVHRHPHRLDRRLIGAIVVPVAHPVRRRDRGGFGDAHELEAGGPIGGDRRAEHGARPYRLPRTGARARASRSAASSMRGSGSRIAASRSLSDPPASVSMLSIPASRIVSYPGPTMPATATTGM